MFRLVAVSLYSATLNEAARRPLKYLYSLPTENYTIDVSGYVNILRTIKRKVFITYHGLKELLLSILYNLARGCNVLLSASSIHK